jgi:hypothetical protein
MSKSKILHTEQTTSKSKILQSEQRLQLKLLGTKYFSFQEQNLDKLNVQNPKFTGLCLNITALNLAIIRDIPLSNLHVTLT